MERRAIAIYGTVQGVGFRPFVHNLASRLSLEGFVKNQAGSVQIEVEGETEPLDQFLEQLTQSPPPLARIEALSWKPLSIHQQKEKRGFEIHSSEAGTGAIAISPDIAACEACLREMFDPRDRRFRYPFINCTHCGPRLTIMCGAPYDRERTTMAGFPMCAKCRAEYENPRDRRFHAQPIACADCGPRLSLLDAAGKSIPTADALEDFVIALRNGKIGALKGLGGFHLVCDARNPAAVAALRQRKQREEKPFAVMVADLESARTLCEIDAAEAKLLTSPARPVVLLRKRNTIELAKQIAPDNSFLGLMLPYTPVHYLLMRLADGPLVMTSGNQSDEPIAYDNADAIERLRGIADIFLTNDRPIHVRCDDSVTRIIGENESPIRRSRGYAPQAISLPFTCSAPILAVGGQLKGTFALGNARRAILSHHMGDLDHFEAYRAFERDVALYEKFFAITPAIIAHDMHPDYASTRYALARVNVKCVAVQHHHAHIASCMAEHGLTEPVIGIAFDGSGFGPDGAVWGGELMIADYQQFRRAAHLRYVALPGGEQAVRQPWRMATAHLADANASCNAFESRQSPPALRTVRTMIDKKLNSPLTSSAGRLFDAVASLCAVRDVSSYEGQAAMQLEALATAAEPDGAYPCDLGPDMQIDTRPLIRAITADVEQGINVKCIARRFHSTLVDIIADVCKRLRASDNIEIVALSGGVFMNALLSIETERRLRSDGFTIYRHEKVPPNDGGLCLGQLAIAASQLQNERTTLCVSASPAK